MTWLQSSCSANLTVDVQTFTNFTNQSNTSAVNPTQFNANTTCFTTGVAGDIVLVRTYYQWTIFTPLLNAALVNMGTGTGKRLITAAASFRNEPYSTAPSTGAGC